MSQVEQVNYDDLDDDIESLGVDQSQVTPGTSIEPPAEGRAFARLIEYIELGKHAGMYLGKPKKPSRKARVTIELHGKKYPVEEVEGVKYPKRLSFEIDLSQNEKSKFTKLFRALNFHQKYKHMAQMARDRIGFLVTIHHDKKGEGENAKTYAGIFKDGAWQINAPYIEDPVTGETQPVAVPEALLAPRIFLFDKPNMAVWSMLYIEGKKDDGSSKNWLQEKIMKATDFEGSPLHAALANLPDPGEKAPADAQGASKSSGGGTAPAKAENAAKAQETPAAKAPVIDPLGDI